MGLHTENPHKIDLLVSEELIWCSTQIFELDRIYGLYTRNKATVRYLDAQKERASFRLNKVPRGWTIHVAPLVEVNGMLISELGNQTRVTAQTSVNGRGLGCTIASFILIPPWVFATEDFSGVSLALRATIAIILLGLAIVLTFFWIERQKRALLKLITEALIIH